MPPPTEPSLLSRYLLPHSSLPTILPYSQFLLLLPSTLRTTATNNPHSATAIQLKRLYQDLQFQRDIDVDTVAQNIARECGRSEVLRGRLKREVREELDLAVGRSFTEGRKGAVKAGSKKRKRGHDGEDEDTDENEDEEGDDETSEASEQEQPDSPVHLSNLPNTTNNTASTKHDPLHSPTEVLIDHAFSGPRGLTNSHNLSPSKRYHTPSTLLSTMHVTLTQLTTEITELDKQSKEVLEGMTDTVGGMSDLRYGKFSRVSHASADGGEEEEKGLENEVVEALRDLTGTLNQNKISTSQRWG